MISLYFFLSETYNFAASELAGEFGFGSDNKLLIDIKIVKISYVGDHLSYNISKQIEPSL